MAALALPRYVIPTPRRGGGTKPDMARRSEAAACIRAAHRHRLVAHQECRPARDLQDGAGVEGPAEAAEPTGRTGALVEDPADQVEDVLALDSHLIVDQHLRLHD